MKIIFRTAALAALIIAAACGKDDSPGESEIDQITEQQEQTPLETNLVADNVVINGSTKEEGTPPTPNEAISLDISNAGKTAFLNEGFEIPFSSDGNVVGAYLQFKGNDGTVADSYYDINVLTNSAGKTISNKRISKKRAFNHSAKVNEATLDVDFNTQIEPGTFCYVVCVYDAEGNISAPEEVCVTVESWGGNSALIGNWNVVKEEDTFDGTTEIYEVGLANCEADTYSCSNGGSFEYEYCYTIIGGTLNLKEDGTYTSEYEDTEKYLSSNSNESCEAIYNELNERYIGKGNWTYIASENRFALVEYEYTAYRGGIQEETTTYDPGDGDLFYAGTIDVNGNSFSITETYDYDGNGVDESTYIYYFEK